MRDDGTEFDPTAAPAATDGHYGLGGMRERVQQMNGNLVIESKPGEGTVISVDIPFT